LARYPAEEAALRTLNRNRTLVRYGLVILICLLIVIATDLITNELNTTRYYWDFALYYDMAEHGLIGNHNLWAPFAYRFATPLLAGGLSHVFALPVDTGFKIIAYIGAVAQLCLVFVLAESLGLKPGRAWIAVAVVALSLYNLKFLIFDVSRPDHLAYPLMVVAILALFKKNILLCLGCSCFGLLVREFLIIPPVLLLLALAQEYYRTRSRRTLAWIGAVFVSTSLFVIVPRVVIPIQGSGQYIDPINESGTLSKLTEAPLSERRDFNILFNLVSYALPVLLLVTVGRARRAWVRLAGYRMFLVMYTGLALVLTMYGGTDLWRFTTYLFIPLVMVLAALLQDDINPAEILYMLVAVALYNKILRDIPNYYIPYLDFYGGYDNRINEVTLMRLYELATYWFGAQLLRGLLQLSRRGWLPRRAAS
jgi:hypothetical protein